MKQQILIFPFNGNGLEAVSCLSNEYDFIGFIDDTPEKLGKSKFGYTVYSRDALTRFPNSKIIAVPGSPQSFSTRNKIISDLRIDDKRFTTIIHPTASLSPLAKVGKNVLVMAGVVITGNAVIGDHVCILPNTVIHHDTNIGDYSLIGSNVTIAGFTSVGVKCYIGSGSSIINNVTIGDNSIAGMASNVIQNVPPNSKVAGNPAKSIQ